MLIAVLKNLTVLFIIIFSTLRFPIDRPVHGRVGVVVVGVHGRALPAVSGRCYHCALEEIRQVEVCT